MIKLKWSLKNEFEYIATFIWNYTLEPQLKDKEIKYIVQENIPMKMIWFNDVM